MITRKMEEVGSWDLCLEMLMILATLMLIILMRQIYSLVDLLLRQDIYAFAIEHNQTRCLCYLLY